MAKLAIAGAMALAFQPQPATVFVANPYIEKVTCAEGSGTAFKTEAGWLSVHHVTKLSDCRIDGRPILVTYSDPIGDFSRLEVIGDRRRGGLRIDCGGFRVQQWYHAQGHARGGPLISIPIMRSALLAHTNGRGWSFLIYNRVIPGQSGGPILSNSGAVVGTVNAYSIEYPISFSRALKDTEIC